MKVDIEQIEATLLERKIDPAKVQEVIKDLVQAVEEDKADAIANAAPKLKWEHVIMLNDPDAKLAGMEFTGWVIQQKEGQDAGLVFGKLADAAKEHNDSAKKKKLLIKSYQDVFAYLKAKFTKEKGLRIKTKEPVRVLVVSGKSPI